MEKNGNWDDLRLFLAVAREGGLSAAARATGSSAATLGRRMFAIERSLGCDLFHRHDRGYELTRDGERLLSDLSSIEPQILRVLASTSQTQKPLVKVSAGTWTTHLLLSHLREIVGEPPDIRLRFLSSEQDLSILQRQIVIGFRNRRPTEDGLAGQKLNQVQFAPYGTSNAPEQWIKVLADTPSARWLDKRTGADAVCEVKSPRDSLDLALSGVGHALLPTFIGEKFPELTQVGNIIPELSHDQWLVTHQDDRSLPEVRRTIDRMRAVILTRGLS
ncbi:LysR family transcriptional regulator [Ruegeria meonggei]|nr:LysR family transcriptional regulator [Ruegeria meonggei]